MLTWKKDGDQSLARGNAGEYVISAWLLRGEMEYVLTVTRKGDKARESIGGFSSLKNAQSVAQSYDGYRSGQS